MRVPHFNGMIVRLKDTGIALEYLYFLHVGYLPFLEFYPHGSVGVCSELMDEAVHRAVNQENRRWHPQT